jgi:hypothetical protein
MINTLAGQSLVEEFVEYVHQKSLSVSQAGQAHLVPVDDCVRLIRTVLGRGVGSDDTVRYEVLIGGCDVSIKLTMICVVSVVCQKFYMGLRLVETGRPYLSRAWPELSSRYPQLDPDHNEDWLASYQAPPTRAGWVLWTSRSRLFFGGSVFGGSVLYLDEPMLDALCESRYGRS